jgi:hypothetical protein
MRYFFYLILVSACFSFSNSSLWGFFGHKKITRLAIYTLPEEMMHFYKQNAMTIIEKSVAPDQRRYVIPEEGPRHYIDLDNYPIRDSIPKYWFDAVEKYGEDSLMGKGTVPWHAYFTFKQLVKAYTDGDYNRILTKSSDLAHYLADANVPLHTTSNYNGQQTGQKGIHGFWETRLPQLFSDNYDFFVGGASYLSDPQEAIWSSILQANQFVDSVLIIEKEVTQLVGESKKFAFEDKGKRTVKVYSEKYSKAYHEAMPIIELQMRRSIKLIGDFWFTAWVEAGQPNLMEIKKSQKSGSDSLKMEPVLIPLREHQH